MITGLILLIHKYLLMSGWKDIDGLLQLIQLKVFLLIPIKVRDDRPEYNKHRRG